MCLLTSPASCQWVCPQILSDDLGSVVRWIRERRKEKIVEGIVELRISVLKFNHLPDSAWRRQGGGWIVTCRSELHTVYSPVSKLCCGRTGRDYLVTNVINSFLSLFRERLKPLFWLWLLRWQVGSAAMVFLSATALYKFLIPAYYNQYDKIRRWNAAT